MSNIIRSTTNLAIHIAREYIVPGGIIVDATCGNGHDTLALAKAARSIAKADCADAKADCADAKADRAGANCIQPHILAFDIQQEAIDATGRLLMREGFTDQLADSSIRLICDSHENMAQYLTDSNGQTAKANLIVFNLGYLPGGDKSVTTKADSTLEAIRESLVLLAGDGGLCITMYSGHEEGAKEKAQLLDFARNLDSHEFHVAYVNMANQPNNPPELLVISRKI
ncbi:MAG: class I SAM-dependent methyltransferase [Clostridia bacterium]|nr:class I SAM-dependent methyltransferase [Clostridia bacterium]